MARAKRYFIPGYVWHISHRCHKKDFLLKFAKDRYHATAIQTGRHLIQYLVYIDLNMVRAGVVSHPSQWAICGYNEIQRPKERYGIIDFPCLMNLLNINGFENLKESHYNWVAEGLKQSDHQHIVKWTESASGWEARVFLKR